MSLKNVASHGLLIYEDSSALERARSATVMQRQHTLAAQPGITVVVLNLNKPELIVPQLEVLTQGRQSFAGLGLGLQVIVGDTGSTDPQVLAAYQQLGDEITVVRNLDYHFSACNNICVWDDAVHEYILFLNNDVLLDSVEPILQMYREFELGDRQVESGHAVLDATRVGIVGLRLDFPDDRVQHLGIDFLRAGELTGLPYHPSALAHIPHRPGLSWSSLATTGAALMVRADLFAAVGGFDEGYEAECQDVDLCLAVRRLGYGIRVVDAGPVVHLENATRTRGEESSRDRRLFLRRWGSYLAVICP